MCTFTKYEFLYGISVELLHKLKVINISEINFNFNFNIKFA